MQLDQAIALYLANRYREVAPATRRNLASTLNTLARSFPDRQLDTITRAELRVWRDELDCQPRSCNKYLSRVKGFFAHAYAEGWCPADPAVTLPPVRVQAPPPRTWLTATELEAMLTDAPNPRDRAALAVAYSTMLRGSELSALRVGDVDLDGGWLNVTITKPVPDTDRMPMTADLRRELIAWFDAYQAMCGPLDTTWYLIPRASHDWTRGYDVTPTVACHRPYRIVTTAMARQGLYVSGDREGFHTVRRSVARLGYDHLVATDGREDALSVVSALLHHKSRATTELYIGTDGDRTRRDSLMGGRQWMRGLSRAPVD
jgi:integrase